MTRFLQFFAAFAFVQANLFAQVSPAEPQKSPRVVMRATVTVEVDGQTQVLSFERTSEGSRVIREVGDQAAVLRALFEPGKALPTTPPAEAKAIGVRASDADAMWVAVVRGQHFRALPIPFDAAHPFPEFHTVEIAPAQTAFPRSPLPTVPKIVDSPRGKAVRAIRLPLPQGQFLVLDQAKAIQPVATEETPAESDLKSRVRTLEERLAALELRLSKAPMEGL